MRARTAIGYRLLAIGCPATQLAGRRPSTFPPSIEGGGVSRHQKPKAKSQKPTAKPAFSLIEVLMAIVILGIGIISIAALFPAGIMQQRLSGDDFMGPTVANHAASIIRTKVSQEDFGTFEEFYIAQHDAIPAPGLDPIRTIQGDWGWMRPSFLFPPVDGPASPGERGAIDIFSHMMTNNLRAFSPASEYPETGGWENTGLRGIPYNLHRYEAGEPPRFIITQTERYYPMRSQLVQPLLADDGFDPARPQYVWDCMFRRYNGRIYMAIFVYRVSTPGTAAPHTYIVERNPSQPNRPPMPMVIDLNTVSSSDGWAAPFGPWHILYEDGRPLSEVRGFNQSDFDLHANIQAWQAPRQWILDQNNNIHRVVSNRRQGNIQTWIEFARPLAPVQLAMRAGSNASNADKYSAAPDTTGNNWPTYSPHEYTSNPAEFPIPGVPNLLFPNYVRGVVTRFWYVPLRMEIETTGGDQEYTLTPVYVTVKEL